MAETSLEKKLSLKIMVDKTANKVVFAEANKEFVDFLFGLMSLPLSTVTKLLLGKDNAMVGSLGTLYKSIESLNDTECFKSNVDSDSVFKPRASLLRMVTDNLEVSGSGVYMVTDNLEVKPMSIALIKSLAKKFDALEEIQVQVGLQEGLDILKGSLETSTVLSNVFRKMFDSGDSDIDPWADI